MWTDMYVPLWKAPRLHYTWGHTVRVVPSFVHHPFCCPFTHDIMVSRLIRLLIRKFKAAPMHERKEENFIDDLRKTTVMFCMLTTMHGFKTLCVGLQTKMFTRLIWCMCALNNYSNHNHLFNVPTRYQRAVKGVSITIWSIICLLAVAFSFYLGALLWHRFSSSPTLITLETTNEPIWELRFPAVTICNNNKVYAPAAAELKPKL